MDHAWSYTCRLWRRAIRLTKMRSAHNKLEKRAFLLLPATQVVHLTSDQSSALPFDAVPRMLSADGHQAHATLH